MFTCSHTCEYETDSPVRICEFYVKVQYVRTSASIILTRTL